MNQPIYQLGNLFVFAKHPILVDVSKLLVNGLDLDEMLKISSRVNIFVGVHQFDKEDLSSFQGLNIGVQTEHFFDEDGKKLWGVNIFYQTIRALSALDCLIDFSHANRKAYARLPNFLIKSKIIFGPYIFPKKNVFVSDDENDDLVFIGAINQRRSDALEGIEHMGHPINRVQGVHGDDALSLIAKSKALIKLHFEDGVYSEWPRILMAYLSGKIIISEKLSSDLIPGRHYIEIDSMSEFLKSDPSGQLKINRKMIDNMSQDFLEKYSFQNLLLKLSIERSISNKNFLPEKLKPFLVAIFRWKFRKFGIN